MPVVARTSEHEDVPGNETNTAIQVHGAKIVTILFQSGDAWCPFKVVAGYDEVSSAGP